jgi:O-antigen ligase
VTERTLNATPVIAAVLVATIAGAGVGRAPWTVSLLITLLGLGAAGLWGARVWLLSPVPQPSMSESAVRDDAALRAPRYVFYAGAASVGFLTVRPAAALTASDWLFFGAFGLTCLVILASGLERDYLVPSVIAVGVVVFAAGGIVSSYNAVAPMQSLFVVFRLLYLTLAWFWLGTILLQSVRHVECAALAWVSSAALCSVGAILQFLNGHVILGGEIDGGRMPGFTDQVNQLGGLAAISLVPAFMFAADGRRRSDRLIGIASTGLIVAGLLLSGSVGALLAVAIAAVFWLALRGVTARTLVILSAGALAALVLISATGATSAVDPLQRIRRVTSSEEAARGIGGSVYTRVDGYRMAWKRIVDEPVVGVGLDNASSKNILGDNLVHNLFLNPWFAAGIFGVAGVLLLVCGSLAAGAEVVRRASETERSLAIALLASVISFVIFAMGEPILYVRFGWFGAMLLIALWAQQKRALGQPLDPGTTTTAFASV